MIKKINFKNLNTSFKAKSKAEESIVEKQIPDKFEAITDNVHDEFTENAKSFFSKIEYPELITSLQEANYWSDSVNFIGFNTKNNKLHSVNAGLFDTIQTKVKIHTFTLDEFKELLTDVTAHNIIKTPENEVEYKKLYLSLLNYIKNNRYTE